MGAIGSMLNLRNAIESGEDGGLFLGGIRLRNVVHAAGQVPIVQTMSPRDQWYNLLGQNPDPISWNSYGPLQGNNASSLGNTVIYNGTEDALCEVTFIGSLGFFPDPGSNPVEFTLNQVRDDSVILETVTRYRAYPPASSMATDTGVPNDWQTGIFVLNWTVDLDPGDLIYPAVAGVGSATTEIIADGFQKSFNCFLFNGTAGSLP